LHYFVDYWGGGTAEFLLRVEGWIEGCFILFLFDDGVCCCFGVEDFPPSVFSASFSIIVFRRFGTSIIFIGF
jgi:hypothetical protein